MLISDSDAHVRLGCARPGDDRRACLGVQVIKTPGAAAEVASLLNEMEASGMALISDWEANDRKFMPRLVSDY